MTTRQAYPALLLLLRSALLGFAVRSDLAARLFSGHPALPSPAVHAAGQPLPTLLPPTTAPPSPWAPPSFSKRIP